MADPDLFLFVSHVREDREAALEIVDELERRGVPCWIAPRDVRPGKPFDDEIVEAIETSRALLLIFSDCCNEHNYIRREVTVAGESQKVVIPFRIEDAQPRRGLRVRLSDLHWIDGFVSRERALDQVVRTFDPDRARRQDEERRLVEEQRRLKAEAEQLRQQQEAERRQREAEQRRLEADAEQLRQQQEEEQRRRQQEETERQQQEEERRLRQEAEEQRLRQQQEEQHRRREAEEERLRLRAEEQRREQKNSLQPPQEMQVQEREDEWRRLEKSAYGRGPVAIAAAAAVALVALVLVLVLISLSSTGPRTLSVGSYVLSVAFSPDGRTLASGGGDGSIMLWDTASGRLLYTLSSHTKSVTSVAFSSDRRTLASGSEDETVKLWDVAAITEASR